MVLISFSNIKLELSYIIDLESRIFLFTVSLISYSVFNFSYSYIRHDKDFSYFHILLFVFVARIIILIFSRNIIGIILGWDGLGVSSYILVIYYGREKSYVAGAVTLLTNRLGDFLIILRIGYLFRSGSIEIGYYPELALQENWVFLLLFVGACTKRAQIPFRAWLPAAMAAPTPVSSLVHSSTLVTAGVYLLLRNITWVNSFIFINVLFFIGCITIVIARLSAINEKDIKKMVALSTLSQLGLIIIGVGLGRFKIAFIHLIIHAFFKAIIFVSTGNLIHLSQSYQSVKNTGIIFCSSPVNSSIVIISSIRLIGLPFIAAFFSKEPIIEIAVWGDVSFLINFMSVIGVLITCIYSFRFVLLVLGTNRNLIRASWSRDKEYLLHKGVYLLVVPSFRRGLLIRSYYITPRSLFYRRVLKFVILFIIITSVLLIIARNVKIIKHGEWIIFNMWNLSSFTRGISNKNSLFLRIKRDKFIGRVINNLLRNGAVPDKSNPVNLSERSFVFRLVSVIPVFLILLTLLN